MQRKTPILLGLVLLLFAHQGSAQTGLEKLHNFLAGLQTMQASFEQLILDAENNRDYRSSGTFYLSRPGRFRWSYEEPEKQYIVADGRRVWLVEEDLEQVSHRSQKAALKSTPAALLMGDDEVEKDFEITELGSRLGMTWLELTPKDEESQFLEITLAFDGDELSRLEMADKFGQITRFRFSRLEMNKVLDPLLFTFVPPPGYDVFSH